MDKSFLKTLGGALVGTSIAFGIMVGTAAITSSYIKMQNSVREIQAMKELKMERRDVNQDGIDDLIISPRGIFGPELIIYGSKNSITRQTEYIVNPNSNCQR